MTTENYDAILIGSGIGALTVASILAQFEKKRVLVLERHFRAGGFTHAFSRKNYHWDVGVHYIGNLEEGGMLRRLFDVITGEKVKWQRMTDPFEKFVYPDFTFPQYGEPESFKRDLIAMFPQEEQAIGRYLEDVQRAANWFGRHVTMKALPPFLDKLGHLVESLGLKSALVTTREYMEEHIKDPKLRALLVSQWGDYGLPPSESTFVIHSLIVAHYLHGGYYPVGGAGTIADAVQEIVEAAGGKFLVSHDVTEILIEGGRAVGVKVRKIPDRGQEQITFKAPVVVSNAGVYNTYNRMLPKEAAGAHADEIVKFYKTHPVTTNVTLYLGLKESPAKLGIHGENFWIYSSYDHDANFAARHAWIENGKVPGAYVSFPSMKDPDSKSHTAEIIAFCGYEEFQKWNSDPWKKRGPEYETLKTRISELLIDFVEKHMPGLKALIDYSELSTPVTTEHFTGHPLGSIYGIACVPARFQEALVPFTKARTDVEGLFLTGADVSSPGVAGAMMGGFATLPHLMKGFSIFKVFRGKK
jgi:all-trans-retinol 13,14-reductase